MPLEFEDPKRLPRDCSVFYCWQDHADKKLHRFLIREALLSAISKVQHEIPNDVECVLRVDSDTQDRAGSVEIADTILKKIESSSILVADVTPTLFDATEDRFYPNPNVMLEIGHGAKALGWNRVMCVFNELACKAEKLPFDIRHRRVTPYLCKDIMQRKEALKQLEGVFVNGLRAILLDIARSSVSSDSPVDPAVKRRRDVILLRQMLCSIHLPTLDRYISAGLEQRLVDECNFFFDGVQEIVTSSKFRFYDEELQRKVVSFYDHWHASVYHSANAFSPADVGHRFVLKQEYYWDTSYKKTLVKMGEAFKHLHASLRVLLDHIHHKYPEIDATETDDQAWKDNLPYIRGDHVNAMNESKETKKSRKRKKTP